MDRKNVKWDNLIFIVICIMVFIVLLIVIFSIINKNKYEKEGYKIDVEEKALEYFNAMSIDIEIINISKQFDLYRVDFELNNNTYLVYITKDFELLIINFVQLNTIPIQIPQETTHPPISIPKLIDCLNKKQSIMFGSKYCSYCKKQKEYFDNYFTNITYVECTEEMEKCEENNITGFPTWKIDNKYYPGLRTLEELNTISNCRV